MLQRVHSRRSKATLAATRLFVLLAPHLDQPRWRQHCLGRRLQGRADALRRARRSLRWRWPARSVAGALGRLRRHRPTAGRICRGTTAMRARLRAGGERQRRAHGRIDLARVRRPVRAGAGIRRDAGGSGAARARQPRAGLRCGAATTTSRNGSPGSVRCRGAAVEADGRARRLYRLQRRRAARARVEDVPGRHDREPVDSVGLREGRRRSRRLSPRLAARPRRERRAAARRRRHRRCARSAALSRGHAGSRRPLAAEHVARRRAVLERHADGRNGVPDPARRSRGARAARSHRDERRACGRWSGARRRFLVRNGPVSQQDRWEEDAGYSPFTLGAEIAALLAAADLAEAIGEPEIAAYLRETADVWNANIERWTYVAGHALARQCGVDGLLRPHRPAREGRRRLADRRLRADQEPAAGTAVPRRASMRQPRRARARALRAARRRRSAHRQHGAGHRCAACASRRRAGPSWRRYNGDGYGEHEDGARSTARASAARGRC